MHPARLAVSSLSLSVCAYWCSAHALGPDTPDDLVLSFESSTERLDRSAIAEAIQRELPAVRLLAEGSAEDPTLIVSMTDAEEIALEYHPTRNNLRRSIPLSGVRDLPRAVAQLAGNLVRNEAFAILSAAPTTPSRAEPERGALDNMGMTRGAAGASAPYLRERWLATAMIGGGLGPIDRIMLTIQPSKRFGRWDFGVPLELAAGGFDAQPRNGGATLPVNQFQMTLPVSAAYGILAGEESYLQLGASLGLRLAALADESFGFEWGQAKLAAALHATFGLAVGETHGLVTRATWSVAPDSHIVRGGDAVFDVEPLEVLLQVGWQVAL